MLVSGWNAGFCLQPREKSEPGFLPLFCHNNSFKKALPCHHRCRDRCSGRSLNPGRGRLISPHQQSFCHLPTAGGKAGSMWDKGSCDFKSTPGITITAGTMHTPYRTLPATSIPWAQQKSSCPIMVLYSIFIKGQAGNTIPLYLVHSSMPVMHPCLSVSLSQISFLCSHKTNSVCSNFRAEQLNLQTPPQPQ